jgi:hypothetical protein
MEKDQNPSLKHSFSSVQTFQNVLSLWDVPINICWRISDLCQNTYMPACRNITLLSPATVLSEVFLLPNKRPQIHHVTKRTVFFSDGRT